MPPNMFDLIGLFSSKPETTEEFKKSMKLWNALLVIFFWSIVFLVVSGLIGIGVLIGKYWS